MITEPGTAITSDDLPARWDTLLPGQPELGRDVLRRWSEPHRHYHTTEHLAHVLAMINELTMINERELTEVRLAAWFHDAVYVIGAPDNESASAALAANALDGLVQRPDEVARLIMVTADHRPRPDDRSGALLCDADLAILASAPAAYDNYVAQVRAEYAAVADDAFTAGRLTVLTALRAEELFHTERGRALRTQARANLDREIADLTAKLNGG
ncbi:MAG: hypothetical protein L0G99_00690 [Propionibacteriales bacterium]|nr:hypothetical protein [Propionibacteriales bacterium]